MRWRIATLNARLRAIASLLDRRVGFAASHAKSSAIARSIFFGLPVIKLATLRLAADSDDLARVYRFDLAQDSEMISPTITILMSPGA